MEVSNLSSIWRLLILVHLIGNVFSWEWKKVPQNMHGVEPTVFIDKETQIKKGALYGTIQRLSTEWSVELELKLATGNRTCDIITIDDSRSAILVLFYMKSKGKLRMYMRKGWPCDMSIQLKKEYTIQAHQRYQGGGVYKRSIIFDGEEISSQEYADFGEQYYDLDIHASNNYNTACVGTISELKLTNFL
ncbi:uncharacterized protein [Clytia hemisphaerica]|uniref:Cnidarian restricted protein n=1 Tax=Clytia hemisphaerica TaxID=252671 RepID=A0A7M5V7D8_9CNID